MNNIPKQNFLFFLQTLITLSAGLPNLSKEEWFKIKDFILKAYIQHRDKESLEWINLACQTKFVHKNKMLSIFYYPFKISLLNHWFQNTSCRFLKDQSGKILKMAVRLIWTKLRWSIFGSKTQIISNQQPLMELPVKVTKQLHILQECRRDSQIAQQFLQKRQSKRFWGNRQK